MNIIMNVVVLELLVAAIGLLSAALGISTRHDRTALVCACVGVVALAAAVGLK